MLKAPLWDPSCSSRLLLPPHPFNRSLSGLPPPARLTLHAHHGFHCQVLLRPQCYQPGWGEDRFQYIPRQGSADWERSIALRHNHSGLHPAQRAAMPLSQAPGSSWLPLQSIWISGEGSLVLHTRAGLSSRLRGGEKDCVCWSPWNRGHVCQCRSLVHVTTKGKYAYDSVCD